MITSILKALEVMEAFSPERPAMALAELSSTLGYPKTTLYTILSTLESKGYVEKGAGGVYSLGSSIIPLTQAVRVNAELRDTAAPLLRELGDFSAESVYLAIHDDTHCLYIYAIESPDRLLARSAVGERALMHYTSVGKAILAFLPDDEVHAIVARTGLPESTPRTITTLDQLNAERRDIRERGYSRDNAEHEDRTFCVGCPIFDRTGRVIAACSVSGTDEEILTEKRERIAAAVRYTAQEISRRMGCIPTGDRLIWKQAANPMY